MQNGMDTIHKLNKRALVNLKPLSTREPLGVSSRLGNDDKPVKVLNLCTHSIEKAKLFFCNKVSTKDGSSIDSSFTKCLLSLDGREVSYKDLPIDVDPGEYLEVTSHNTFDRINSILGEYGEAFEGKTILKCRRKDIFGLNYTVRGDLFRVFIKWENGIIRMLIFDPWHHLATDKYESMYTENKSKYKYNIDSLK